MQAAPCRRRARNRGAGGGALIPPRNAGRRAARRPARERARYDQSCSSRTTAITRGIGSIIRPFHCMLRRCRAKADENSDPVRQTLEPADKGQFAPATKQRLERGADHTIKNSQNTKAFTAAAKPFAISSKALHACPDKWRGGRFDAHHPRALLPYLPNSAVTRSPRFCDSLQIRGARVPLQAVVWCRTARHRKSASTRRSAAHRSLEAAVHAAFRSPAMPARADAGSPPTPGWETQEPSRACRGRCVRAGETPHGGTGSRTDNSGGGIFTV